VAAVAVAAADLHDFAFLGFLFRVLRHQHAIVLGFGVHAADQDTVVERDTFHF
jgi:hypothetical protein